jgi:hypothetical protein
MEKLKALRDWLFNYTPQILLSLLLIGLISSIYIAPREKKLGIADELKGNIQNHLTWSIKGECYFVRPTNDERVYLIRVEDCDKK